MPLSIEGKRRIQMALNMNRRKKTGDDDDIPMAPMIDCVFLLLIFFMVSAIMRVPPPFTVTLPDSATKHEFTRKKFNLFISTDGRISIDDQEMITLDDMELFLAAHESQISTLIIKADKRAKHGVVIDVVERAKQRSSKAEGLEIAFAVSEEN
jgi:biopolymer transport protein ExbD